MNKVLAISGLFVLAAASSQANIALGKSVTDVGTYGVLRAGSIWAPAPLADPSTLTDGVLLPEGQTWNNETIWWDADVAESASNYLEIDLAGLYNITSIWLQGDDNDEYVLDIKMANDAWVELGYWGPAAGGGMRLRGPDSAIFQAKGIRVRGRAGDKYYSVSEFGAEGTLVPEPATMAALGFGALAMLRRRRK